MLDLSTHVSPGVGILYNRSLADFLERELDAVDCISVIPDMLRTDHGMGSRPRFTELRDQIAILDRVAAKRPLLAHSIGLSIGSAGFFDEDYLEELARWQQRYGFLWHSEHLSFSRVIGENGLDHHAALALPVPYDREVLDLLIERVRRVQAVVPGRFLLENNVYFTPVPEQEMREPEFLNAVSAATGCGLLLDLHNIYTNARNFPELDCARFLDELDLGRVIELHIAGGNDLDGVYVDSHAAPCPEAVWDLLTDVVHRAPNLRAVTLEFDEAAFPIFGNAGVRAELDRARAIIASAAGH